jgi:peptidoglycan/LPS O-acetylase OafA/YrhL
VKGVVRPPNSGICSPAATEPEGYLPHIDGLRAIAVTAVVIFHIFGNALRGGWLGVEVFFVLSGYLITGLLRREWMKAGRIDLISFYGARAFRLLPALTVLLIFYLCVGLFRKDSYWLSLKTTAIVLFYGMNWARAFSLASEDYLGHTWSLAVEEQFYIVFPFILLAIIRSKPIVILTVVYFMLIIWRFYLFDGGVTSARITNGLDTRADGLLIGCILSFALDKSVVQQLAEKLWPLACIGLIVMIACMKGSAIPTFLFAVPCTAICTAIIIAAARASNLLQHTLSNPVLVYIGTISYGVYLWHFPIFNLALTRVPLKMAYWAAPASYFVAAASRHWVELPFLNVKRRWQDSRKLTNMQSMASR